MGSITSTHDDPGGLNPDDAWRDAIFLAAETDDCIDDALGRFRRGEIIYTNMLELLVLELLEDKRRLRKRLVEALANSSAPSSKTAGRSGGTASA